MVDGKNIIIEKLHTINDNIAKYNKGHLIHHYKSKLALVRDEKVNYLEKGILINGYYDQNYYHWIVDIIPQLQYIQELPESYDDFPILISEMTQKIKSIKEVLSLFNIEREIVFFTPHKRLYRKKPIDYQFTKSMLSKNNRFGLVTGKLHLLPSGKHSLYKKISSKKPYRWQLNIS